jgi:hypothetical protein
MQNTYSKTIRFLNVYITEAHAADEWPVGRTLSFCNQPRTIDERLTLARTFVKKYNLQLPMVVDGMENAFVQKFDAWPFRYFVVNGGRIMVKAQPDRDDFKYYITSLASTLETLASCA